MLSLEFSRVAVAVVVVSVFGTIQSHDGRDGPVISPAQAHGRAIALALILGLFREELSLALLSNQPFYLK